jgi:indolepyruvate ferredoxin oxidoreductase beta subunit
VRLLNSNKIAADLGNSRAQNIVLLGVIVKALGLEKYDWKAVIKEFIPEKLQDLNIKAFEKGFES